jgi:hypothetical protein
MTPNTPLQPPASRRPPSGHRRGSAASGATKMATAIALGTLAVAAAGVVSSNWIGRLNHETNQRKLHQADVAKCFDPKFLDQLVDPNPKRRQLALILLNGCGLEKEYVADVARAVAIHDASPGVRSNAASTLKTFANDNEPALREASRQGLADYGLAAELRDKGLLRDLKNAADCAETHSPDGQEKALRFYLGVLSRLSPAGTSALGAHALAHARDAANHGYIGRADGEFAAIFRPYTNQ